MAVNLCHLLVTTCVLFVFNGAMAQETDELSAGAIRIDNQQVKILKTVFKLFDRQSHFDPEFIHDDYLPTIVREFGAGLAWSGVNPHGPAPVSYTHLTLPTIYSV